MNIEDEEAVKNRDQRNAEYLKAEAEQDKQYAKQHQKKKTSNNKQSSRKPEPSMLDSAAGNILKPASAVAYVTGGLSLAMLGVYKALNFFNILQEDTISLFDGQFTVPVFGILVFSLSAAIIITGFLYKIIPQIKTVNLNLILAVIKIGVCSFVGYTVFTHVKTFIESLNWF